MILNLATFSVDQVNNTNTHSKFHAKQKYKYVRSVSTLYPFSDVTA